MSMRARLSRAWRAFAGIPGPGEDYWYIPVGDPTQSGQRVTPEGALQLSAVYACVRVLTETISSLPLIVYQRTPEGGKQRADGHPLFALLHDQPNPWQSSLEFIEMMQGHLELRGNAYAEIIEGPRGFADQLIPLNPDRIEVRRLRNRMPHYRHRDSAGNWREITFERMFHLRGWGTDGYIGVSPITLEAEAVGLGQAAQRYAARFYRDDASPGGVLQTDRKLSDKAYEKLSETWGKRHAGEPHKHAILEEGLKWQQVGISPKDAQFLESRKFQAEEIARIFRVQPHKIGLLDKATFSNIEHQAIEFVVDTILPRLRRWEHTIRRDLILRPDKFFAEFLVEGLLRGDTKSRYEAYSIALGGAGSPAFMTVNEVRRRENLNPVEGEGADSLFVPMNVQPGALIADDWKRLRTFAMVGDSGKDGETEAT